MTEQELFWRNQSEERERWLKERESELAALRQQLAEARAEVETLAGHLGMQERNAKHWHDECDAVESRCQEQLAAQAAELERLQRELDGAVHHHAHNMDRIDRALGEPRYKDCYLVQAFERRIAEKDAELERLRALSEARAIWLQAATVFETDGVRFKRDTRTEAWTAERLSDGKRTDARLSLDDITTHVVCLGWIERKPTEGVAS